MPKDEKLVVRVWVPQGIDDNPGKTISMHLPIASAWRWVVQRVCPVTIEVPTGRVCAVSNGKLDVVADAGFSSKETVQRRTNREATHLIALPIRSIQGVVEGMATVELGCTLAVGDDFILAPVAEDVQMRVDIAAPYLVGLPLRPVLKCFTDELLPIVGTVMTPKVGMQAAAVAFVEDGARFGADDWGSVDESTRW